MKLVYVLDFAYGVSCFRSICWNIWTMNVTYAPPNTGAHFWRPCDQINLMISNTIHWNLCAHHVVFPIVNAQFNRSANASHRNRTTRSTGSKRICSIHGSCIEFIDDCTSHETFEIDFRFSCKATSDESSVNIIATILSTLFCAGIRSELSLTNLRNWASCLIQIKQFVRVFCCVQIN